MSTKIKALLQRLDALRPGGTVRSAGPEVSRSERESLASRAIVIVSKAALVGACAILLVPAGALAAFLILVRTLRESFEEPVRAPSGGDGAVRVVPDEVIAAGEPVPVSVVFTVGPGGIEQGGAVRLAICKVLRFGPGRWRLRLQWGSGWGTLQRRDPGRPNYVDAVASRDGVRLSVSMMEKAMDRTQLRWLKRKLLQKMGIRFAPIEARDTFLHNLKVTARVEEGSLAEGDTVEFKLGGGAGLRPPLNELETDFAIEFTGREGAPFELASAAGIEAVGGRPSRFEVVAPTLGRPGQTVRVLARCVDDRGVLSPGVGAKLTVSCEGPLEAPRQVILAESAGGTAWFLVRVVGAGIGRVKVASVEGGLQGESDPVVCTAVPYVVLWGDMHTHSIISDGTQEPGYLYRRARAMGRDFTGVSDHDTWSFGEERARSPEEFALMMAEADTAYGPGEFVTLRTYEWTNHRRGHRNVVFGPSEEPVFLSHTEERYSTPRLLLEALAGKEAMVVPHHPAWKIHAGEMRYDFGPLAGEAPGAGLQRLVEVYSRHGNSEFYGCPRPMSHVDLMEGWRGSVLRAVLRNESAGPGSGSYVRDALAAGHRLGLVAGGDEHVAGVDPRHAPSQVYSGGITGIFATAATREAVWDALWNRRVCGTTGARMLLEFRVNGVPHGAEMRAEGPVHVTGHVVGTAALEEVELVKFDSSGYRSVWQGGGGREATIDWTDGAFGGDSFYYLRVVQDDGHLGWAGPTWVDKG